MLFSITSQPQNLVYSFLRHRKSEGRACALRFKDGLYLLDFRGEHT